MLGGEKSAILLKFWWFHIVSRYHPRVSLPRLAPKMGKRLSLVCPGSEPQGQMLLPNSHARFVRLLIYDERVIRTTVGNCYPSLPRTFCGSGGLSSSSTQTREMPGVSPSSHPRISGSSGVVTQTALPH